MQACAQRRLLQGACVVARSFRRTSTSPRCPSESQVICKQATLRGIAKSTVWVPCKPGPPKVDVLKRLLPMQWSIMPFFRQLLGQARVHGAFGGSPSWVVIMDRGMKSFRLAAVSFPRYDHRLPACDKDPASRRAFRIQNHLRNRMPHLA